MPLKCDGGEPGVPCEACQQARNEAFGLYELNMKYFAGKDLSVAQEVQAITLAALTAIEVIAHKNKLEASEIVVQTVSEWIGLIALSSQSVDAKTSGNVYNVMLGNTTLN